MHSREPERRQRSQPKPGTPAAPLALQRMIGNSGMGQLLQRKEHKKDAAPKKPAYKAYELDDQMAQEWSYERLKGWGDDRTKEGNLREAAAVYEAAYWKKPGRDTAWAVTITFRALKEQGVAGAD